MGKFVSFTCMQYSKSAFVYYRVAGKFRHFAKDNGQRARCGGTKSKFVSPWEARSWRGALSVSLEGNALGDEGMRALARSLSGSSLYRLAVGLNKE